MIKVPYNGVFATEALRPGKKYSNDYLDGATYSGHIVSTYCIADHPHVGVILNLSLPADFNETEFLEQFKSAMAATPYSVTLNVSKPAVAYQVVIRADKPQPEQPKCVLRLADLGSRLEFTCSCGHKLTVAKESE